MYSDIEDTPELLRRLAKAISFTERDLAENRDGRLSSQQMTRVGVQGLTPFLGLAATLLGLVALVIGIAAGSEFLISKVRLMLSLGKYLVFGLGTLLFGFVAVCVKFMLASERVFGLMRDLADGKVTAIHWPGHTEQVR